MLAPTPPMGWNSWDCFGGGVTEAETLANARYMAQHLKGFGWEYVVVDGGWYLPARDTATNRPHTFDFPLDAHGRLLPDPTRFPGVADGHGLRGLADAVHALGLKFGLHQMRGIPRQAVAANTAILGSDRRAADIADRDRLCTWNADMFGVDAAKPGAAEYYQSVIDLCASWHVDFLKFDDMCSPYHAGEIELVRRAIDRCGRPILLSLSPGGRTPLDQAAHLRRHAEMWRISADFWDFWHKVVQQFDLCARWAPHAGDGHWPDADMLPLGHIGIRQPEHGLPPRYTYLSRDEQVTLMTLWCMARSPLIFGGHLPDNDRWTLSLLTNAEVLRVLNASTGNRELLRQGPRRQQVVWTARAATGPDTTYAAVFNLGPAPARVAVALDELGLAGAREVRDLWRRRDLGRVSTVLACRVPAHGARLLALGPAAGRRGRVRRAGSD